MVQAQALSRRDRVRAATTQEILQTARQLLVDQGASAISLRAIAREMGMTAPALYRYFGSHEELLRHVCASIFTELGEDIHRAIHAASLPAGGGPAEHLTVKMVAACREFRRWALTHKAEFSMLFGVPLPGLDDGRYDVADECALAFAGTPAAMFTDQRRQLSGFLRAGTYVALYAVGYADTRPWEPVSSDNYADGEMTAVGDGVAQAALAEVGAPQPAPHCPGTPGC